MEGISIGIDSAERNEVKTTSLWTNVQRSAYPQARSNPMLLHPSHVRVLTDDIGDIRRLTPLQSQFRPRPFVESSSSLTSA